MAKIYKASGPRDSDYLQEHDAVLMPLTSYEDESCDGFYPSDCSVLILGWSDLNGDGFPLDDHGNLWAYFKNKLKHLKGLGIYTLQLPGIHVSSNVGEEAVEDAAHAERSAPWEHIEHVCLPEDTDDDGFYWITMIAEVDGVVVRWDAEFPYPGEDEVPADYMERGSPKINKIYQEIMQSPPPHMKKITPAMRACGIED